MRHEQEHTHTHGQHAHVFAFGCISFHWQFSPTHVTNQQNTNARTHTRKKPPPTQYNHVPSSVLVFGCAILKCVSRFRVVSLGLAWHVFSLCRSLARFPSGHHCNVINVSTHTHARAQKTTGIIRRIFRPVAVKAYTISQLNEIRLVEKAENRFSSTSLIGSEGSFLFAQHKLELSILQSHFNGIRTHTHTHVGQRERPVQEGRAWSLRACVCVRRKLLFG